jgi:hypothetical protein
MARSIGRGRPGVNGAPTAHAPAHTAAARRVRPARPPRRSRHRELDFWPREGAGGRVPGEEDLRMHVWRRIRALFTSRDDLPIELVMSANGLASLAIAGMAWFQFGLSVPWIAAVVASAFLLPWSLPDVPPHGLDRGWARRAGDRRVFRAGCGRPGAGLPIRLVGRWWLGALGGLVVAYSAYARVGKIARSQE